METVAPATPVLIGLDWGTSSLRAFLLDVRGSVIGERAESWGIMQLGERDFAEALGDITAQWPGADALPVIACGMVGSAQGWIQAPYCPAPAGAAEIAAALLAVPGTSVHVVAGVAQYGDADVMRGEETQLIGALGLIPELRHSRVVCPGTHSKWVTIDDSRIDAFTTYMTGELYAVLVAHSILGRPARGAGAVPPGVAEEAFRLGVRTARDSRRDSASLLFGARARVLLGEIRAEASLEYLSGVLIGSEVRDGLALGDPPSALIGDAALCARYVAALHELDVRDARVVEHSAPRGLWQIAVAAGLCATSTPVTTHR